jgi:hypothetical protein
MVFFRVTVVNRDYHYLSQNETPNGDWAEIMWFWLAAADRLGHCKNSGLTVEKIVSLSSHSAAGHSDGSVEDYQEW